LIEQLQRLDLSDCLLTDQLANVFQDAPVNLSYLALSGCRLSASDVRFLEEKWANFAPSLVELDLGSII
jgi:hypothetical protein